jgi:hypothetical protein
MSTPANGWPPQPAIPKTWPTCGIVIPSCRLTAIELYDVNTGKLLRKLKPKFADAAAPGRRGSILKFKFSPDEQLLFGEVHETDGAKNGFSSERVSVSIWKAETGKVLQDMVLDPAMQVFWRETLSRSLVRRDGHFSRSPTHGAGTHIPPVL